MAAVDAVIPTFNENPTDVLAALEALRSQSLRPASIVIVDDASTPPVSRRSLDLGEGEALLRLDANRGAGGARNRGAARSRADFVAFLDIEVLPPPDWIERAVAHFEANPGVAVITVRTRPRHPERLFSRWRELVQEPPLPDTTAPVPWALGHAIVVRRQALDEVSGFDARVRAGEDLDLCFRLRARGWEIHFLAGVDCVSTQKDSAAVLGRAEYNRFCDDRGPPMGLVRSLTTLGYRGTMRSVVHLVRGRPRLIVVEPFVFLQAARIATLRWWERRNSMPRGHVAQTLH